MADEVTLNLDKESFIDILRRAAGRDRTVIEFQTTVEDGQRVLDSALDITDHVESLEDNQDRTV